MTYEQWQADVSPFIRQDPLWHVEAYRRGLFLGHLSWHDATTLLGDPRCRGIADQLFRAAGNVSSNVSEGCSRGTSAQRALFYGYALGSTREARDWYYKGRAVLGADVTQHRLELATAIIRLLLTMIRNERNTRRRVEPRTEEA